MPFWLIGASLFFYIVFRVPLPRIKHIGIGMLFFVATLTPWSLYLYSQTGSVLPISSHLPYVLDKSYNTLEYDTTATVEDSGPQLQDVIVSKVRNFFVFWNPGAGGYQAEQVRELHPLASHLITLYKVGFFSLLTLAFLSVLLYLKKPHAALLVLGSIVIYVWALHTVLYPYPRYMLPVVPLLILLAGYTMSHYRDIVPNWSNIRKK